MPPNYDLDVHADEHSFLQETPVYCPVPWCNAHNLRFVRCGDKDGDYEGLHVARIEYAKKVPALVERELKALRDLGHAEPETLYGFMRARQDAIDMGMGPKGAGRKGRRYVVPGSRFNDTSVDDDDDHGDGA